MMPTVLDACGVACPDHVDGSSFVSVLEGNAQEGRDKVFTQFHQTAARRDYPMRCVQTKRFGYIFNPWSDGERVFINESQSGRTMAAMKAAAGHDPGIAARVELFLHRVVEECYDFASDPDGLHNLVGDPAYEDDIAALRAELRAWMEEHGDPALDALDRLDSREARDSLMALTRDELGERVG
jgi:N-sulfoglucosamine sulfohydrolase